MGRGVELILAVLTVWLAWVPFSPHAALLRRIPIGSTVGANVQAEFLPIGDPSIQCALAPMLPLVEAWPYPLDAEVWRQPNRSLVDVVELLPGKLDRPETITVDEQGNLYFLEQGAGRITWAPDADLTRHELFANTGGSPLGGVVTATGDLVYADASKGLMMVEAGPERAVRFLTDRVSDSSTLDPGTVVAFADGVTVSRDGTVYFTDASVLPPQRLPDKGNRYEVVDAVMDSILQGPSGRLLRYSPATGETTVLMKALWFANGVALSADESFVLVAATLSNRVHRFWLLGPKAGTHELFTVLPGVPDGISLAPDGGFWVAMYAELPPLVTYLCRFDSITISALMARVPRWLLPVARPVGMVAKLSSEGQVLRFLLDENGTTVSGCTSAVEHAGKLYLGNVHGTSAAVLTL